MISNGRRTRLLVVGHQYHLSRFQRGFYDALDEVFELSVQFVENGWPDRASDLKTLDVDVVMWYVRFSDLQRAAAFDWERFPGRRVMYDEDALMNFSDVGGQQDFGAWPLEFHRHAFELLVCTGRQTRDSLMADGVPSVWLPKAYDPKRLFNLGQDRAGIGYFGSPYPARRAMLDHLRRAGLNVKTFQSSSHDTLNEHLNSFEACLICNMEGRVRKGPSRIVNRLFPRFGVEISPGPEPLLKNFEVAGAGCAPVCDWIPELDELGFQDGVSMISYLDFNDLEEKLRSYLSQEGAFEEIGARANRLVASNHTWIHRALSLAEYLQRPTPPADDRSETDPSHVET